MKKSSLLPVWGIFYIICAVLGFIPDPQGSVRILLMIISVLFFVPPAILLFDAIREKDRKTVRLVRLISGASLGATLLLFIANILTLPYAEWVGTLFHALLGIVSAPMFCSNYWVLSLFLWAMLFVGSIRKIKD